jgi:hypothetical protein
MVPRPDVVFLDQTKAALRQHSPRRCGRVYPLPALGRVAGPCDRHGACQAAARPGRHTPQDAPVDPRIVRTGPGASPRPSPSTRCCEICSANAAHGGCRGRVRRHGGDRDP